MTDENQIEDQDIEAHDDEQEIEVSEMKGHDPKNAEAQSVASVDKAGDATGGAPKRSAAGGASDNATQDPMPKMTKAGMVNAMYKKMKGMKKGEMEGLYAKVMHKMSETGKVPEGVEADGATLAEVDFKADLNALVAEEATLSDGFKEKAAVIFEAAINSKLSDEIDRLEEKYNEELASEVESTKAELVEKVDSYLNYVVEQWMEDNKVAIQTGLRTEIAEDFMGKLKDLFTESYIEVPEGKVDVVDELAQTVEDLEARLDETTGSAIEMQEELEELKKEKIINENSKDLAETEVEKLKSLVKGVDFEDAESFTEKVNTVKESYFNKQVAATADIEEEDGEAPIVASDTMSSYLSAIKKQNKS